MKTNMKLSKEEFEKNYCFTKHNVEEHEYKMQKMIYNLNIINVPKIYSYDKENKTMVMEKIFNMNIADEFGEDAKDVPQDILEKIQEIIRKLYYAGVEYPDITGYNFIKYKDKIYLIDFEHSKFFSNETMEQLDPFVIQFINGLCDWNPNYK